MAKKAQLQSMLMPLFFGSAKIASPVNIVMMAAISIWQLAIYVLLVILLMKLIFATICAKEDVTASKGLSVSAFILAILTLICSILLAAFASQAVADSNYAISVTTGAGIIVNILLWVGFIIFDRLYTTKKAASAPQLQQVDPNCDNGMMAAKIAASQAGLSANEAQKLKKSEYYD